MDRRQNKGSVKAVCPRHCPATSAPRNCCFNCPARAESQGQCPLHCCWGTTRSERSPTFAGQFHLPAHDLFWANLRVQLHLPPLDLAWNAKYVIDGVASSTRHVRRLVWMGVIFYFILIIIIFCLLINTESDLFILSFHLLLGPGCRVSPASHTERCFSRYLVPATFFFLTCPRETFAGINRLSADS